MKQTNHSFNKLQIIYFQLVYLLIFELIAEHDPNMLDWNLMKYQTNPALQTKYIAFIVFDPMAGLVAAYNDMEIS